MMALRLILILILFLLSLYCIIPDLWFRYISPKVLRRGNSSRRCVYFTFDDGPHPVYTLQILDILKKYNVKAFFFVLGKKAERSPQIIKAISDSGHIIGTHGYSHRPIWLLSPRDTIEEFKKTDQIILDILRKKPRYVRPPWGGMNLGLIRFLNREDKQIVFWSLDSRDWQRDIDEDDIVKRVLERVKPGDIILFHDGRWEDISRKTVEVLPKIIEGLRDKGYEITNDLDKECYKKLSVLRNLVRVLWELWDRLFYIVTGTIKLDDPYMILSFSINRYRWRPIYLKDGTIIRKGDRFVEIHFLNNRVSDILRIHKSWMGAGREIKERLIYSFDKLMRYIEENGFESVKAFHGITVLYRLAELDGVDIFDINPFFRFFVNLYEKLILIIYHPEGLRRLRHRRKLTPKSIWVSKDAMKLLIQRYKR